MSTEELEKYKKMYSELILELVEMHNDHINFLKWVGRDTGYAVRKHLKAVSTLTGALKKQNIKVCTETMANRRLAKLKKQEEKKKKQNVMVVPK